MPYSHCFATTRPHSGSALTCLLAADDADLVRLWSAARGVAGVRLADALASLRHHLVEHFALEEQSLTAAAAPGAERHARDHATVLAWLDHAVDAVGRGALQPARRFLDEDLPRWFQLHHANLDRQVAHVHLASAR